MTRSEAIQRIKNGKLWWYEEKGSTVFGIGTMLLPVQIEWEDDVSPDV